MIHRWTLKHDDIDSLHDFPNEYSISLEPLSSQLAQEEIDMIVMNLAFRHFLPCHIINGMSINELDLEGNKIINLLKIANKF